MTTFHATIKRANESMLEKEYGDQAALLYMLELCKQEELDLYSMYDDEIPQQLANKFAKGLEQLLRGVPLAHVLGYDYFYGYQFIINENVLIPRCETEELIAHVLRYYDQYFKTSENVIAADIGCGSGAIAIAIQKEEPNIHMIASDISEEALVVAKKNAKTNDAFISFMIGDMLEPLIDRSLKVDILISNPPYIPQHEQVEHSVIDFEPHIALFGGEDGLKYYRKIFEKAKQVLKSKAMMAFEIGYDQKTNCTQLAKSYFPDAHIHVLQDMSGKDRMLFVFCNCEIEEKEID